MEKSGAAKISTDLLLTKLAPPRLRGPLLPRAGLLARLDQGLAHKATLISAPAGYGKSTLAASWLAARDHPAAWVALDAGDNDPIRFWRYIVTALSNFDSAAGKRALGSLLVTQQPSFEAVLVPLLNHLANLSSPSLLVLEDYHAITAPEIHDSVAFLLEHLPAALHLVLIARGEPPLPLARLRARNELNDFAAADLRFSPAEIEAFLQQNLAEPLSPEAVTRLEARTEGWPAGLRLAALALAAGPGDATSTEEFLATFGGGQRRVLDYLAAEVLAGQPEAVQTLLLHSCFLNRLTGGLCNAVTGRNDGEAALEQLQRAGMFLSPLGGSPDRPWYRFHALFAEAMRQVARTRLGEAGVQAIYAKAGRWYEAHALLSDAVEAALAAGEFERAAELIEKLVGPQEAFELHTLRRWVQQLPQAVLHARPLLCFKYAVAVLFTADRYAPSTAAMVEPPLRAAEEAWRAAKDDARLGEVLALRSILAQWQGDLPRSFTLAREALEFVPEDDLTWRSLSLCSVGLEELLSGRVDAAQRLMLEALAMSRAARNIHAELVASWTMGEICFQQGDLDQAASFYEQVLAEAVGGEEMLDDQSAAWLGLSAIAYERDDLSAAEQHAARALALAEGRGHTEHQAQAGLLLARVAWAQGRREAAAERLAAVRAHAHPLLLQREVQAWQARLALAEGDLAPAERWQAGVAGSSDTIPDLHREREALITARLRLAQGEPQPALALLEGQRAEARANGRGRSEIEILVLQALAHFNQADSGPAEQALTAALAAAHGKGIRRPFLDEGEPMAALLKATLPKLTRRNLKTFAGSLLAKLGPGLAAPALVEPLSPQEQRVLRLLAAGYSNADIARELVVSINTVKTQVRSIYRKLDVSSREAAREAARELNLI